MWRFSGTRKIFPSFSTYRFTVVWPLSRPDDIATAHARAALDDEMIPLVDANLHHAIAHDPQVKQGSFAVCSVMSRLPNSIWSLSRAEPAAISP